MTAGRGDEVIGDPVWDYTGLLAARRLRDAGRRLRGSATAAGRPWWQVARGALAIELRRSPNLDRPALGPELRDAVDIEQLRRGEVRRTTVVEGRGQQLRYGRIFGYAAQQLTALDARAVAGHGMVLVDPFTDRRVVEWVLSVPQYEVTRPDRPKHLLRAAVRPWMPPGLEFLSGADLSALYARGLFDRRRSLVERLFATSELAARGYIRGEAYEEMYSELRAGKPRVLFEWALAAELWVRRHWSTDRGTP
jgi:asparagine synthase (glutamine-hydrolysing)